METSIFRKVRIRQTMKFKYKEECLEIVDMFMYLGVIFTVGGSCNTTFWPSIEVCLYALIVYGEIP